MAKQVTALAQWFGGELNEDYAALAKKRINTPPKWSLPEKPKRASKRRIADIQPTLFS